MSELDIVVSIALGVGLAAAVGFRVFLPLLVMSGAAYGGLLPLSDGLEWLATPTALAMLSVAALGDTIEDAQKKAYRAIEMIQFEGMHYRKDIGRQAVRRG